MTQVQSDGTVAVAARDEELDAERKKDAHCLAVPEEALQPICPEEVVHG